MCFLYLFLFKALLFCFNQNKDFLNYTFNNYHHSVNGHLSLRHPLKFSGGRWRACSAKSRWECHKSVMSIKFADMPESLWRERMRSVIECERSIMGMTLRLRLDYLVHSLGNCVYDISTKIGLTRTYIDIEP